MLTKTAASCHSCNLFVFTNTAAFTLATYLFWRRRHLFRPIHKKSIVQSMFSPRRQQSLVQLICWQSLEPCVDVFKKAAAAAVVHTAYFIGLAAIPMERLDVVRHVLVFEHTPPPHGHAVFHTQFFSFSVGIARTDGQRHQHQNLKRRTQYRNNTEEIEQLGKHRYIRP